MNWLKALEPPVRLRIRVRINGFQAVALVDTGTCVLNSKAFWLIPGAAVSKISASFAHKIGAVQAGMSGTLGLFRYNKFFHGEIVTGEQSLF